MLETALGILGWRPCDFWDANVTEYTLAVRGHLRSKGIDPDERKMDTNRLHELIEMDKKNGKA